MNVGAQLSSVPVMRTYYALWYHVERVDGYLIWYSNDPDGVLVDDGRVPAFPDLSSLYAFATTANIAVVPEEPLLHDLDVLAAWLVKPSPEGVRCVEFLAAWNLFTDVARSIGDHRFDSDQPATEDVYVKLFRGNNLPAMTPASERFDPVWSQDEVAVMCQVLGYGLQMFRTRVTIKASIN